MGHASPQRGYGPAPSLVKGGTQAHVAGGDLGPRCQGQVSTCRVELETARYGEEGASFMGIKKDQISSVITGPLGTYWSDGGSFSKAATTLTADESGHQIFSLDVGALLSNNDAVSVEVRIHAITAGGDIDTDLFHAFGYKDNGGTLVFPSAGGAKFSAQVMQLTGGSWSGNLLQPTVTEQSSVEWVYTLQGVYRIWATGLTL